MKIFPTSSTLTDLVNYINVRTDSHQKIYDFFKNLIVSQNDLTSVNVNFTEKTEYLNSKFPINDSGYVNQPQDMFGGKYLPNNPIISSFTRFPNTRTVPNILDGKPEQLIDIDGDVPNNISLSLSTMSSLSNSTYGSNDKIKYWPTIKVSDFFPISQGMSSKEQDNINGVTGSDSLFSILRIVPGVDEKYHHINIEYSVSDPKSIILILIDGSNVNDGDSVEFKVSFNKNNSDIELNNWPVVLFIDSTYINIAIENTFNLYDLTSETQSLVVDGISYRYIPASIMDSTLYKYLRIPTNDPIGYLVSLGDLNQLYFNKIGELDIIKFEGTSNSIKYSDYGYLNSESLKLDYNNDITMVSRPILGKVNSDVLAESKVDFSKNSINFITYNNNSVAFGAQTNQYSYNLSAYSTATTLASRKVITDYLPIDYPKQIKNSVIDFNSEINSGIFFTFDISSDLVGNNYYIINTGIQFINSFFSIRKHNTSIIVEEAGTPTTINTTETELSVDIGYKRVSDSIYKRLLLRANSSLLHDSGWVLDRLVSDFPCELSSISSPFIENYQVCDLDFTNSTNIVTVSNILIHSKLTKAEVDSLFQYSILNGIYSRGVNTEAANPKVLPVTQLDGLLATLNQYPKSNISMSSVNALNSIYNDTEYRIGFTAHSNKGDFNYRGSKNPVLDSEKLSHIKLVDSNLCGDFAQYETVANIECDGILNALSLPYFSNSFVSNGINSKQTNRPYNSKILNKSTLISFGKCGYAASVNSIPIYSYGVEEFYINGGSLDHIIPGAKKIQSFKLQQKLLSLPSTPTNNTLNRFLYYFDEMQTLSNSLSTLPKIFDANYGDNIDILKGLDPNDYLTVLTDGSLLNTKEYLYVPVYARYAFEIQVPSANSSNLHDYDNTIWQLRYITKDIDPSTVGFNDIDLVTDTVVITEAPFNVYKSVLGEYNFAIMFEGNNYAFPLAYLKNGIIITMKTEYIGPDVAVPTDATNIRPYQGYATNSYQYPFIQMRITRKYTTYSNTISYEQEPKTSVPVFNDINGLTPHGTENYKTLDSEYIDEFKDFPTIHRMLLSTYYQIPKYSK